MYDGDILNNIALIQPEFIRMFRKFDPLRKYIMSRETGSLNKLFAIGKGQLVDLVNFANFKDGEGLDKLDENKLMSIVEESKKLQNRKVIYGSDGKLLQVV